MSLNRCEQRIFDYFQVRPEEKRHWQQKVQAVAGPGREEAAAAHLDGELWRYYLERSAVAEPFREAVRHEGSQRVSMRNLAELLIRLWTAPRPKPKREEGP